MTAPPTPAPIFLVGAECSGTVLLRLMLHNHPQVTWCDEFEYAVDLMSEAGEFPDLSAYYDWLATHRIFQSRGFIVDTNLSYPELLESFLNQQRDRHQKPIVGAIVHRHFDRLLHIWPAARFIHVVRDPRDVAQDVIRLGWSGNVWMGVERWQTAEQLWSKVAAQVPRDRQLTLRYQRVLQCAAYTQRVRGWCSNTATNGSKESCEGDSSKLESEHRTATALAGYL